MGAVCRTAIYLAAHRERGPVPPPSQDCINFENITQQQDVKPSCNGIGINLATTERRTAVAPGNLIRRDTNGDATMLARVVRSNSIDRPIRGSIPDRLRKQPARVPDNRSRRGCHNWTASGSPACETVCGTSAAIPVRNISRPRQDARTEAADQRNGHPGSRRRPLH